jgi:hypothetical protein
LLETANTPGERRWLSGALYASVAANAAFVIAELAG